MPRAASATLRALASGLVDYAGLFPPAALPMAEAVHAFATYHAAPDAWMLGRFVVPVGRLGELAAAHSHDAVAGAQSWRIAALAGADVRAAAAAVRNCNVAHAGRLRVDVVEVKTADAPAISAAAEAFAGVALVYAELPVADDPDELVAAIGAAGVRAKVRTGGVTPDAFPTAAQLARFILRCAARGVQWKATAGLHHPLRAEHALTYEAGAPRGTMFGFLNVFAAGAFARSGAPEADVVALLEERDPAALVFDDSALQWRGHRLSLDDVAGARATFATSFGSCSFREPVDELHQLGLL
ncbi:MAG: hypothetical protein JWN79_450 [Gemmatimonadetes bacterium]|nr:hypothetical protein [Gemmatimonadota bacterium]